MTAKTSAGDGRIVRRGRLANLLLGLGLLLGAGPAAATPIGAPVVVLDPGHGGTNRGAPAVGGEVFEKSLTLTLARLTRDRLKSLAPGVKVVLSRTRDTYLTLDQRVRAANALGARLFVSIHFNANEFHNQRGFETYLLSRQASDKEAARLAQRENRTPQTGDSAGTSPTSGGAIGAILSDLKQSAAHAESVRLAQQVQRALAACRGEALDRGVRQANFDVLKGLRMAGVLVELGFLDHPEEGPELLRAATQQELAGALAQALAAHLEQQKAPPRRPRKKAKRRRAAGKR